MKKVRNLVLFLLLLLSFSRCEKDRVSEEAVTPGSSFTVEQAEAWFGADWQGTVSLKSGHTENTRIGIKPDWCNGFTSQNDEVEVVEVGLLTQG